MGEETNIDQTLERNQGQSHGLGKSKLGEESVLSDDRGEESLMNLHELIHEIEVKDSAAVSLGRPTCRC
jgi:hypothetical protein